MTMNNTLAAVLSKIENAQRTNKPEVTTLSSSKVIKAVLEILKEEGYITSWEEHEDVKGNFLTIVLSGRLNRTGVITPKFNVTTSGFVGFEKRYLPAKDFGILILTTNKGIITHKQAKEENVGGKLLAYAY